MQTLIYIVTRPGSISRTRSIRCRTRPTASRSRPRRNCSSATRRYGKPGMGDRIDHGRRRARAGQRIASSGSGRSAGWCTSSGCSAGPPRRPQPKVLIVAPMSGHYATLLRGTVEACCPTTTSTSPTGSMRAWCRSPTAASTSTTTSTTSSHAALARRRHACHGGLPAVGAGAGRGRGDGAGDDRYLPRSMTLMGGPIDTRATRPRSTSSPRSAASTGSAQRHHQGAVPASGLHARRLSGLPAALRLHEHEPRPARRRASRTFFHLVEGRRRFGQKHREFYDEYLAVMDLTAEFYLQTVETVFVATPCRRAR
jgi:poly(3-hydroxybutyrate) depolymerase